MESEFDWRLGPLGQKRWNWLKTQPQDAWLLFVRHANWDESDGIFAEMLNDPNCDRAIAAWLFWNSAPDYPLAQGKWDYADVTRQIVENYENGYYRRCELFLDRYSIAPQIYSFMRTLRSQNATNFFMLPRSLAGPFGEKHASMPVPEPALLIELDLSQPGETFWDEEEYQQYTLNAEHGFYRDYYDLPEIGSKFGFQSDDLDDLSFLEALYGDGSGLTRGFFLKNSGITPEKAQETPPLFDLLVAGDFDVRRPDKIRIKQVRFILVFATLAFAIVSAKILQLHIVFPVFLVGLLHYLTFKIANRQWLGWWTKATFNLLASGLLFISLFF